MTGRSEAKVAPAASPGYLAAADDLAARRLMHIDRAIEQGQGRTQHGAQRLDGEGLEPPGPALQLDAREAGDGGAMAAGGDDGGIGGDEFLAPPNPADAIARALDAGDRRTVVKRHTALLAGGAQALHEGMMGRRPAIVEDHRRSDPPAIDGGQALRQLRRGERARGDAAVALHAQSDSSITAAVRSDSARIA